MLSKNQIKYIRSLHAHKFRQIHRQYLVEGEKMVSELLLSGKKAEHIYALDSWVENHYKTLTDNLIPHTIIDSEILEKISTLHSPNQTVAIVAKDNVEWNLKEKLGNGIFLVLDNLQDPGNLGAIIRTADWFGVSGIFCSPETADVYNPKVVQATMGSIFRMPFYYVNLEVLLLNNTHYVSYAAALGGNNVYEVNFSSNALLIIGNESKGISEKLLNLCSHKIAIPKFGNAESLNAAVACGVLLGLMKR